MGIILFSLEKFRISIIYIRSRLARAMEIFLKKVWARLSFSLWSFETSDILCPKLEKRRPLFLLKTPRENKRVHATIHHPTPNQSPVFRTGVKK
jgi:hypothetical protein